MQKSLLILAYVLSFFTDYNSISKFLNRMLGMEVICENTLFKYFSDKKSFTILHAKKFANPGLCIIFFHRLQQYKQVFKQDAGNGSDLPEHFIQIFLRHTSSYHTGGKEIWKMGHGYFR